MVRPAEKIRSININHLSGGGFGKSGGADGTAPVNAALDSIMDLAVQLPVLKKIGKSVGIHFDNGLAGVLEEDEDSSGKS